MTTSSQINFESYTMNDINEKLNKMGELLSMLLKNKVQLDVANRIQLEQQFNLINLLFEQMAEEDRKHKEKSKTENHNSNN